VDTIALLKALEELDKRIECVVAPPVWYGPSSFAVAGQKKGTIDVDAYRFERRVMDVLSGFLENGFRKSMVVIHHQFEMGPFMPEALAFKKAAAVLIFRWLRKRKGKGMTGLGGHGLAISRASMRHKPLQLDSSGAADEPGDPADDGI
jgi:creatinine amidohydrolase